MNFYSNQKRYLGDSCLLNFKLKSSILLAALTSITLQAQDNEIKDYLPIQAQSEEMEQQQSETANLSVPESSNLSSTPSPICPADFFTLPLYPNAKFCQLFAQGLPASMSYFAISDQQSAKEFYINHLGQAEQEKMLHGRIVLQYSNGQKIVVISKDGQGSQIDILIKSAG
tara:strand:- start:8637 stop:9149 length:513 start_codon:yes stop_codon:yes gene_type:complete